MSIRLTPRPLLLACALAAATVAALQAQVIGISYTLAPRAAYLFADQTAGLDDGFAVGGDLGLGFGQYVELRANYLVGLNTVTDFGGFDFDGELLEGVAERDVDFSRIGGDVKLNLSRGALLPYLTLGAGVQSIGLDGRDPDRNIYASGGLGIVLSAADRFTLFAEGRFTGYNHNSLNGLLTDDDVRALGLSRRQFRAGQQNNYSLEAGLAFYLGGRRPGELTDLDRAYAAQFGNGFRGASLLLTPTLAYTNFDQVLPYRDAFFGGAALGLDFGPLVGLNAYYLRAMARDRISFDFDELAMYGADFRFNLNTVATGIAPYITLGGGYIDVRDDYRAVDGATDARSQGFAAGGGGITLGLSPNVKLRGGVKALLTSGTVVDDLQSTDQIKSSIQYTAGLTFAFGRRARDPQDIVDANRDAALSAQQAANDRRAAEVRQQYEAQLAEVEAELNEAYATGDTARATELTAVREDTEQILDELAARERREGSRGATGAMASSSTIRLTVDELESLLRELVSAPAPAAPMPYIVYGAPASGYPMPDQRQRGINDPAMMPGLGFAPDSAARQRRDERDVMILAELQRTRERLDQIERRLARLDGEAAPNPREGDRSGSTPAPRPNDQSAPRSPRQPDAGSAPSPDSPTTAPAEPLSRRERRRLERQRRRQGDRPE